MEHCDEVKLSLFIDNMLNVEETRLVTKHLNSCESCRRQYDELNKIVDDLKNFGELELPPGFHQEAMALIRDLPDEQIDIVSKSSRRLNRMKLKPVEIDRGQLFGRFGTIAAGLLITLLLFSGLGSLLPMLGGGAALKEELPIAAAGGTSQTADAVAETYMLEESAVEAAEMPSAFTTEQYALADEDDAVKRIAASEYGAAVLTYDDNGSVAFVMGNEKDSGAYSGGAATGGAEQTIKNYGITLEVDDLSEAMRVIDNLPGYNMSSSMYNYNPSESGDASMTRVVTESEYEMTKDTLRRLGKVTDEWESSQRVFIDIADTQARSRAKEAEIERLYELLKRSDTVNAMVLIERRLEATSSELDSMKSQYAQYTRDLSAPTMFINIVYRNQAPRSQDAYSFGERLNSSFIMSLNVTFAVIEGAAVFVSSIGFQLMVLFVIICVAYGIRNTLKRRREHENE